LVEGNGENRVRLLTFQKNKKPPPQQTGCGGFFSGLTICNCS